VSFLQNLKGLRSSAERILFLDGIEVVLLRGDVGELEFALLVSLSFEDGFSS
jgi:hypothetical protein